MKIIPPVTIDGSKVVVNTVPEPSAGEVVWTSNTSYTVGDVRIRTTTHRKYQALVNISSSVTTPPEEDILRWKDIGPTNAFAIFDYSRNTASVSTTGSMSFTVRPQKRCSCLIIFGLLADSINVQVKSSATGPIVYNKTFNTKARNVNSWTQHFYAEFVFNESLILTDLPPYHSAEITVTFTRAFGDIECESMIYGSPVDVGLTAYGAESDIIDFSRVERDAFGSATLVPRQNVPKLNATVLVKKTDVPAIRKLRQDYAAKPLVFLGIDDGQDQYFDALSLVGIFKRMPILVEYPDHAVVTIEAEGL